MSAAHITYAEKMSLHAARKDFRVRPSAFTASALLETALDVWNEGHLDDRDYISEVGTVQRWLADVAKAEARS